MPVSVSVSRLSANSLRARGAWDLAPTTPTGLPARRFYPSSSLTHIRCLRRPQSSSGSAQPTRWISRPSPCHHSHPVCHRRGEEKLQVIESTRASWRCPRAARASTSRSCGATTRGCPSSNPPRPRPEPPSYCRRAPMVRPPPPASRPGRRSLFRSLLGSPLLPWALIAAPPSPRPSCRSSKSRMF